MALSELEVGPLALADIHGATISPLDATVLAQCTLCGYLVQTHVADVCECGVVRCTVVGDRATVASSGEPPEFWRQVSDVRAV